MKKEKEKKKEEEKRSKLTTNFQHMIQEMEIRQAFPSEMIRQTTEEKIKSTTILQSKTDNHQEEDHKFNSVETAMILILIWF